jgi:hypothetical protein
MVILVGQNPILDSSEKMTFQRVGFERFPSRLGRRCSPLLECSDKEPTYPTIWIQEKLSQWANQ